MKKKISFYCNIALSFYLNIACENRSSDEGLSVYSMYEGFDVWVLIGENELSRDENVKWVPDLRRSNWWLIDQFGDDWCEVHNDLAF